MKMNKLLNIFIILLGTAGLFAESASLSAANKKTAERCLSLAENCIAASDWQNALNQAELGLAYNNTISDLIYVKAAAMSKLGKTRAEVLETVREAFIRNNWVNYNKNSARILYGDLLCDTGDYEKSLEILNNEPFLYSADAEFIRIKNYYRIGTDDSIAMARNKLNSSRKIYPLDERFPQIFFMFESLIMNYAERKGLSYKVPEIVKNIADSYIVKFPDYSTNDVDMEIRALMFANGEQQKRILKAVGEKNQNSVLFAIAGLKTGIISEEKAYNIFFKAADNTFFLNDLECFALLLKDSELRDNFKKFLNSFSGTLIVDEDIDLRNELIVDYERGRAAYIYYDKNNDQINELYAPCDFGTPMSVSFAHASTDMFYYIFPAVNKVNLNSINTTFYFLNNDYEFNPFDEIADSIFKTYGVDFYIPYIKHDFKYPDEYELSVYASAMETPTKERENSKVVYTVFQGRPVFASFSDSSKKYGYCTIEPGCPFVRYVDYDNDDIYETAETFDLDAENKYETEENQQLIKNIFGENTFSKYLYLKKIEIDRNSDTIIEYREEFLEKNGRICSWDEDSNGVIDYQFIRYPDDDSKTVKELTVFYNTNGIEYLAISNENGKPVSMKYKGKETSVIPGNKEGYYWIEQKGTVSQEETIGYTVGKNIVNGVVQLIGYDDNLRLSVIKVDNNYFCRQIPASEIIDEKENEYE